MKKLIIVCAALTASAGFAATPAAPAPDTNATAGGGQAATPPAKDPNERICRNITQTSTRLGRQQECKTRAEWEAQARRNQGQLESRR
jgi:hypothetical protein